MKKSKKKQWGGSRPGSGRKPNEEKSYDVSCRLRKSVFDMLNKYAKNRAISRAKAVSELCEIGLKNETKKERVI